MKSLVSLSAALCLISFQCPAQEVDIDIEEEEYDFDNSTVSNLNLNRYLGDWYEVARFDHGFERDLDYTRAYYELREDGKVDVYNSGYKNGKFKMSKGKAKTTDNPALLRVSFFGPFYNDYRVLYIDPAYQHVLVGSKSPNYLWILSRKPQMDILTKLMLINEAAVRGYDVDKLIWVKQYR